MTTPTPPAPSAARMAVADIFDLFLTSGIYHRYAERYMPAELIDEVAIAAYLPPKAAE